MAVAVKRSDSWLIVAVVVIEHLNKEWRNRLSGNVKYPYITCLNCYYQYMISFTSSIHFYQHLFSNIFKTFFQTVYAVNYSHQRPPLLPWFIRYDGGSFQWDAFAHPSRSAWWRRQMETFSALLALCAGNSPVTGEFPPQMASNAELWCFSWSAPNKQLSKH